MRQVRAGVFETNSSSTHSITICTQDEYDKWKKGDFVWNRYSEKLMSVDDMFKKIDGVKYGCANELKELREVDYEKFLAEIKEYGYLTYEDYGERYWLECYMSEYETPEGEHIVVFGEYGYDG